MRLLPCIVSPKQIDLTVRSLPQRLSAERSVELPNGSRNLSILIKGSRKFQYCASIGIKVVDHGARARKNYSIESAIWKYYNTKSRNVSLKEDVRNLMKQME